MPNTTRKRETVALSLVISLRPAKSKLRLSTCLYRGVSDMPRLSCMKATNMPGYSALSITPEAQLILQAIEVTSGHSVRNQEHIKPFVAVCACSCSLSWPTAMMIEQHKATMHKLGLVGHRPPHHESRKSSKRHVDPKNVSPVF